MTGAPDAHDSVEREQPLLRVRGLTKRFPVRRGVFGGRGHVDAVAGVDLDLHRGETFSVVGESGSGKTTLALSILRLLEPTDGEIVFDGEDVRALGRPALRALRRRVQIVFQDPYGSLDPRMTAGAALEEVLAVHGLGGADRSGRVAELLESVGLGASRRDAHPHELSGGQRQRLAIARALAVEPELLILDEPVTALDVSVQAQVVNLLADLQRTLGLTYLLIAHDLALVEVVSDTVAVMYLGRVVETAPAESLYRTPRHPYTRALMSAAPRIDPAAGWLEERILLQGEATGAAPPQQGCPFLPRCPHPLKDETCARVIPPLESKAPGHLAACPKGPFGAQNRG